MNKESADQAFQKEITCQGLSCQILTFVAGNESLQRKDPDKLKGNGWLVDKGLNAYVRILQKENNMSSKDHIFVRRDPDTLKGNGWPVDKVLNAYVTILQKENNMSTKDHIFVRRDPDTLKGNGWLVDKVLYAYVRILQKEKKMSKKDHIFELPSYLADVWSKRNHTKQEQDKGSAY